MVSYSGIRHLSLDLWLTLIRSNKAFKPARATLFRNAFNIGQQEDEVLHTFQEYDRLFNHINESTGRNLSRHEMLYIILDALGKDVSTIPLAALDNFLSDAEGLFLQHPPEMLDVAVIDVLHRIRAQGVSISLLSNTAFITGATLRKVLPKLGFENVFHFQVYSDEQEQSKPSLQVFNIVYNEALRLKPLTREQVLHIGDNPIADYGGAIAAGFTAILFNPDKEPLGSLLASALCTPRLRSTT